MPAVLNKAKGQTADSLFPLSRGIPPWRNVGRLAPACLRGSGKHGGSSSGCKIIIIWHLKHQPHVPPKGNTKRVSLKEYVPVPLLPKGGLPFLYLNLGASQSVSYSRNTNCNDNLVKGSASEGINPTILVNFLIPGLQVQTVFGLLQSKLFFS